ncbi:prepilin peptidase-dependent protein [Pectobacterium parvum]|uniref:prepilin peptidase-dependent protein n=1 Tax=Pectobacterium parvum TaxID=2778550 RepID=UPI000DC64343|nr:prepilin peptidase-dependent protein [Pectobacterium parvum]
MTTSGIFEPDTGALSSLLDAGEGPIIVLDFGGELWETFWNTPRWSRLWEAWRLTPGQTKEGDIWDVLGAIRHVSAPSGSAALATALFPVSDHSDLTRRLMACAIEFADDSGHFLGRASGLGELAGQLWADDMWTAIARWSRQYPYNPTLQTARTLLTLEGAGESVVTIRNHMATYYHPHVAKSFSGNGGLNLRSLRHRPGQVIFLTPDIRCMENAELTSVYVFLVAALRAIGELHHVTFALVQPTMRTEGDAL